ncbi:MAG: 4-hydroxy-3-methylbut-2-en-1-yl diphosphate synthase [Candidatus Marinimicrobia bacterium]|jgi:(E)-4-hydroxy-3-methylbut-2-enyl-diphosphate synthase|nr:4-hydroxy-3-methylbut-2-en-1-yl diphosphate synthase [Candidatus Neomarinimicrobiota bacterium]MEC7622474.1 flavodoxin-dependent (E)-4-hydroxy-3-methylbut-2-enyl-diphosphate synthase [Candidatus Neomarinimicrobiota bacterium]MEC7901967.1 flavodoxin-dependent (E)-4-hydroxy-3-methylbut-2-enyl-diphosphate synthase [Candidatus Neomarinimicrobiota bacterium]MED5248646.1 flavodoxin-dependent (E)-4-hydroxy-3-methylbut-2-enyl-diphosphate synthase [Candidatus Neomarinimicrobiota bacterium]|tara:strand:+ start:687 stop:1760 length:1074 start_codon:yes stop_codon:yes gene_type:complete
MIKRRKTREVKIGDLIIGGEHAITVQSMTTTKTDDITGTLKEVERLEEAGCHIIRITVPDKAAAKALYEIKKRMNVPLVADIHFDYRMALEAVDAGADKIRINPGNIGGKARVKEVLNKVKGANLPIRIGVNAGSLEKDLIEKYSFPTAEAMVESAQRHIDICREHGFEDIIVSLKASDVNLMIGAYSLFSQKYDYPLHLGVTEAGPAKSGTVKSAVGLGNLLANGIGDTIRVSLTDDPVEEVHVGFEILKSLGLASKGVTIVSCPTCGRLEVDLFKIAGEVEEELKDVKTPMTLALMGCAVNGPGEATHTDLGIAFGKGAGHLYYKGEKRGKVKEDQALDELKAMISEFEEEKKED